MNIYQSLMEIFRRVQEIWSGHESVTGRWADGWTDGRTDDGHSYNPPSASRLGSWIKDETAVRPCPFHTFCMTLTAELEKTERRRLPFEKKCYRRLLIISYKDHTSNENVR